MRLRHMIVPIGGKGQEECFKKNKKAVVGLQDAVIDTVNSKGKKSRKSAKLLRVMARS